MAGTLKLTVLTPDKTVLSTEVASLSAFNEEGSFGVLPGHQPLISQLAIGLLSYRRPGSVVGSNTPQETIAVMGGVLTTDGDTITVLTPAAERSEEIDVLRAKEAKARAESRLAAEKNNIRAELALQRSIARLKVKNG
jgi:F-type H+-transporting ATPase subunit epsilon